MNKRTLILAYLSAFLGVSGCAIYQSDPQDNTTATDISQQACFEGDCEKDPFINYTQTRADFRENGELSPRDHLISQSGAGNNLSAAVPPSIENEVINYEEQVQNEALEQAQGEPSEQVQAENKTIDEENSSDISEEGYKSTVTENPEEVIITEQASDTNTENAENNSDVGNEQAASTEPDEEDPVQDWYAEEGQNLKALLTQWSEESGWRLVWNSNRNYVLSAGAMFRGRFADVSSALIRAFARARPAPVATFYKGNRVLVVETMEDENAFD